MGSAAVQNTVDWREAAGVRARDMPLRLGLAVFIEVAGRYLTNGHWPALWLPVTLALLLGSLVITEPMRRDADFPVSRGREIIFFLALAACACALAYPAAVLWFAPGWGRRVFAVMILAEGAVSTAMLARGSARRLWVGWTPFLVLLVVLPICSFTSAKPGDEGVTALLSATAALFALHLAAVGRHSVRAARNAEQSLQEARRDRFRAESASASKSDFLAVMTHELRTPLNGVLGMAQVMSSDELTPTQRERLTVIQRSGESLLGQLNDLLDISSIEGGKLQLDVGVVDVEGLAEQARTIFQPIAQAKGLDFRLRVIDGAGVARVGDPMRVRQVLHNLVANAIKFTEAGRVSVLINGSEEELAFDVGDTGVGIAPHQLSSVFEQFSRNDRSSTRRYGGSGLGLAIARGLARLMGGDISVRSELGEGSVFSVWLALPLADASALNATVAEAAPDDRMRVLAAEDNPTNQAVLTTLLEQVGIFAQVVDNGEAAVAAWSAEPWDLILMDIHMPVMDGLTATKAIRAAEVANGRGRTPIVAVTANAGPDEAMRYAEAGIDAVVAKPIQFTQLLAAISGAVQADEGVEEADRSVA